MILSSLVKLSVLILCYPVDSPLGFSFSRSPLPSRSSSSHSFLDKEESPAWDSFQPLLPEICLNHVWQETQIPVRYSSVFVRDNALPLPPVFIVIIVVIVSCLVPIIVFSIFIVIASGARFPKVPKTFRTRKAIRKHVTRLLCEVGLFICCKQARTQKNSPTEALFYQMR